MLTDDMLTERLKKTSLPDLNLEYHCDGYQISM